MLKKKLCLIFLCFFISIPIVYAPISDDWNPGDQWIIGDAWANPSASAEDPGVHQEGTWNLYTRAVGIQQGYTRTGQINYVLLRASNGMMNSSENTLQLTNTGQGYFTFHSNESFTLTVSYDFSHVFLTGDSGNTRHSIENNTAHTITSGNTVTVSWNMILEPYVPYLFIIGMIGLGCLFGGPLLAIKGFKDDPRHALVLGITFTALGIGLFLAWLTA